LDLASFLLIINSSTAHPFLPPSLTPSDTAILDVRHLFSLLSDGGGGGGGGASKPGEETRKGGQRSEESGKGRKAAARQQQQQHKGIIMTGR